MTFKKIEFDVEDDFVIGAECRSCNTYFEVTDEPEECSECGADGFILETSHEGQTCDGCETTFDIWDSFFTDGVSILCGDCYRALED